jgi:hypothetical protein
VILDEGAKISVAGDNGGMFCSIGGGRRRRGAQKIGSMAHGGVAHQGGEVSPAMIVASRQSCLDKRTRGGFRRRTS